MPAEGGRVEGDRTLGALFLALLAVAFVAYAGALWSLARSGARRSVVVALALAIQLAPLAAPLLLSSDAYTYWVYGEIVLLGGDPYADVPADFPEAAGFEEMGEKWRERTSVYGPAFTLASTAVATSSAALAAAAFKLAAALALVAIVLVAARRSPFAAAFVGWNPVLAVHAAGGAHNDAWMAALLVGGIALAEVGRRHAAGAAWAVAVLVKWIPLVLLPLELLATRGRRLGAAGLAAAAAAVAVPSVWLFGADWLRAVVPLAENASETTSYALPHRLSQLGVPEGVAVALGVAAFAIGYLWLARLALAGRARLALAAGLLVLCAPYLTPWYLLWVVPLAAVEEDRTARLLALALTAYLLPQTIPV